MRSKPIFIIGIDCATQSNKTGLALASLDNRWVRIIDVKVGSKNEPVAEIIENWLQQAQPALLALDAPLGWPKQLAQSLPNHIAGEPLRGKSEELFSRMTDRFIWHEIGKKPLEVGANLIARTAFSALKLLDTLRQDARLAIPLAWEQGIIKETSAIEVYPAATLTALRIKARDYRKEKGARKKLVDKLGKHVGIETSQRKILESNSHAIDAVICVLAGTHFLLSECLKPEPNDQERARKEGWIWVKAVENRVTS